MKQFITYNILREITSEIDDREIIINASKLAGKTIFLSHSSKDHDLLPAVIKILENHGGRVYIDDRDSKLEGNDCTYAGKRLRDALSSCRRFVLFVTEKGKDSRWIPWELGLGDGRKTEKNVALFPSAENWYDMAWTEREYLNLYQRIIWGTFKGKNQGEWMVYNHHDNTAIGLQKWIE